MAKSHFPLSIMGSAYKGNEMNDNTSTTTAIESRTNQSFFSKVVSGSKAFQSTMKAHPYWGVFYGGLVVLLGFFSNIAYDYTKSMFLPTDQYLIRIRDEQSRQYEDLKNSLSNLKGSIDSSESRSAFNAVSKQSDELVKSNKNLLSQLELAKQEYEKLSKIAQKSTGISGGYDFILSESSGVRIDNSTSFGVEGIYSDHVLVNVTSANMVGEKSKIRLNSGESVEYKNAQGKICKIISLSISEESASFVNSCA